MHNVYLMLVDQASNIIYYREIQLFLAEQMKEPVAINVQAIKLVEVRSEGRQPNVEPIVIEVIDQIDNLRFCTAPTQAGNDEKNSHFILQYLEVR